MKNVEDKGPRVSERIALRLITLAASKGIMLPRSDTEIQARFDEYADLLPSTNKGECSKWVAAETYAFLRGFQLSGKNAEEKLKHLLKEENKVIQLNKDVAA